MKAIGVFCGSSPGTGTAYVDAARHAGRFFAGRGIEIIYGGGRVGLMGAMADAALAAGGRVTGVIPRWLVEREIAHTGLTDLHVVESLHERKEKMAELASGFVALPGAAGTLEEIFEQWTWAQLGIHEKPCGFLNVNGYFDPLEAMTKRMVTEGFMQSSYADMVVFSNDLETILDRFADYRAPPRKWRSPKATETISASDWPFIRIAAGLIVDGAGRVLLVRKRGTQTFMQAGGKIEPDESPYQALARELQEELGLRLTPDMPPEYLGQFVAEAANETRHRVQAEVFYIRVTSPMSATGEIEEIVWIAPSDETLRLAPLTRDLLPIARQRLAKSV